MGPERSDWTADIAIACHLEEIEEWCYYCAYWQLNSYGNNEDIHFYPSPILYTAELHSRNHPTRDYS